MPIDWTSQKVSEIILKMLFLKLLQSYAKNPSKRVILALNRDILGTERINWASQKFLGNEIKNVFF